MRDSIYVVPKVLVVTAGKIENIPPSQHMRTMYQIKYKILFPEMASIEAQMAIYREILH